MTISWRYSYTTGRGSHAKAGSVASDRAGAMTGTVVNLTCGSIMDQIDAANQVDSVPDCGIIVPPRRGLSTGEPQAVYEPREGDR